MSEISRLMQYDANKKSVLIAYLFWLFLGVLGAHRFYLTLKKTGMAFPGLILFSMILVGLEQQFGVELGMLPFTILVVWVLVDALRMPWMVQKHNSALATRLGK